MILPLVRALEASLVATCATFGVAAGRRDGHPGCWCDPDGASPRKIGALGLRVERGVSYHGIALNVSTDLADFDLIDPCGMPGVVSTSIAMERGELDATPTTASVEEAARAFARALASELDAPITGI
jgi:lipoyl(octanoyl) transferase